MARHNYWFGILSILYFTQDVKNEWVESDYNPEQLTELPGYGESWMYMPNGNGHAIVAILQHEEATTGARLARDVERQVTFDLYTRNNTDKPYQLITGDKNNLKQSPIDFTKDIKFITHGWMSSNKSNTCQNIKTKYLQTKDLNVIVVDWAPIANNVFYFFPMMDTGKVGITMAKLINYLVENGAKLEQIHLIGHSLGAHVSGYAGAGVKHGKVSRITGLDPALPGFELIAGRNGKLDATDADFVDIIHTCGGVLGYYSDLGDVDFYPNGGTPSQPGCFGLTQVIESCSHGRSWQYFEESIGNPFAFPARRCESWNRFSKGDCKKLPQIYMGDSASKGTKGRYYLKTTHITPFRSL